MPRFATQKAVVGGVARVLPLIGSLMNGCGATEPGTDADVAIELAVVAATRLMAPAATTVAITSQRTGRKAMAPPQTGERTCRVGCVWAVAIRPGSSSHQTAPMLHTLQPGRKCSRIPLWLRNGPARRGKNRMRLHQGRSPPGQVPTGHQH